MGFVLGVAAMVVLVGIAAGATVTLREKAARYFAGDVAVFSFRGDRIIPQSGKVVELLKRMPGYQSLARRTEYYRGDSTLFFGGTSIRHRKFVGIDWGVETGSFQSLDWLSGGPLLPGDKNGIVVSGLVAERLHLRLGDEVVVSFRTSKGLGNSLTLIVRGIYGDTSFFGYASYVDIELLNAALGYRPRSVTALGATLYPGASATASGSWLVRELNRILPTHDLIVDRDEQARAMKNRVGKLRFGVMTMDANLADVNQILRAILAAATLACGLFLFVLTIGVSNTYRMVVFERTGELGTMRALGMSRSRVVVVLLTEAGVLGATGLIIGTGVGMAVLVPLSSISWSGNSLALLFLQNGHLVSIVPWDVFAGLSLILLLTTLAGAWLPALRAARLKPVDALREGD